MCSFSGLEIFLPSLLSPLCRDDEMKEMRAEITREGQEVQYISEHSYVYITGLQGNYFDVASC